MKKVIDGVWLIGVERERQISEEKFDASHDDDHVKGELAMAAAAYAFPSDAEPKEISLFLRKQAFPGNWDTSWAKYSPEDRKKELIKAGALIAAELDRLLRIEAKTVEELKKAEKNKTKE